MIHEFRIDWIGILQLLCSRLLRLSRVVALGKCNWVWWHNTNQGGVKKAKQTPAAISFVLAKLEKKAFVSKWHVLQPIFWEKYLQFMKKIYWKADFLRSPIFENYNSCKRHVEVLKRVQKGRSHNQRLFKVPMSESFENTLETTSLFSYLFK